MNACDAHACSTIADPQGDTVSMLTHIIYPRKLLRRITWPSAITRLAGPLYVCPHVWLVICKHYKKHGDTRHRMFSLRPSVIKQHKKTLM